MCVCVCVCVCVRAHALSCTLHGYIVGQSLSNHNATYTLKILISCI